MTFDEIFRITAILIILCMVWYTVNKMNNTDYSKDQNYTKMN